MNKLKVVVSVICGAYYFIVALQTALTGGPTWDILFGLALSLILFYSIIIDMRPNNKKFYAVITAIQATCFIIMGLAGREWGGQGATVWGFYIQGSTLTALYILFGIFGLVVALDAYFKRGRRRIRLTNLRQSKILTNNRPSTS